MVFSMIQVQGVLVHGPQTLQTSPDYWCSNKLNDAHDFRMWLQAPPAAPASGPGVPLGFPGLPAMPNPLGPTPNGLGLGPLGPLGSLRPMAPGSLGPSFSGSARCLA